MVIISEKPLKKCAHCGKDVKNLGLHIINVHPKIMEQLEEEPGNPLIYSPPPGSSPQISRPQNQNMPSVTDINALVREKLELMLNIKVIEMLSKNSSVSLQELNNAINPPQPTKIEEIKLMHDMIYQDRERELPETGNQWIDLATAAIPLIKEMLPAKKKEMEAQQNVEYSRLEERSDRILKPISLEVAGDTRESSSSSEKSGTTSETKQ